ncbi:MAG TPA: IPT/TIG domain-containing protein [Candidatus Sulfotelmatobacter sp.]|nr:IPT/TIG domain-containing protein [Candidatus Sulfotelmatobacter sp.]
MPSRVCALSIASLLAVLVLPGCNNTLNPLCGSARPVPVIGSLSPAEVTFSEVQQGVTITVTGNQFVSASQVVVNTTPIAANIVSQQKLTVRLSPAVVSGPGSVKIMVQTPSGNSGDLGCTSGGHSSVLRLTVD